MTGPSLALDSLRAALGAPTAGSPLVLSAMLPGLAFAARIWADVLNSRALPLTDAAMSAGQALIEITGTLDVLTGPEPVTVRLFQPAGSTDPAEVECLVIWEAPRDGWSPAAAYLLPAGESVADTASQTLLRGLSIDGARRVFSSFDFTQNALAAGTPGLLPDWLADHVPDAGLTVIGDLRLPAAVADTLKTVVDLSGALAITANIDVALDNLQLRVSHRFDETSPPSFKPFGNGPEASFEALELTFPIDGWGSALAEARLVAALTGEDVGMDISLGVDLVRSQAVLAATRSQTRPAPSLDWAVSNLAISGGAPQLPFDLGAITLAEIGGSLDLGGKGLTAYSAEFATSKPIGLFGDVITLQPSLHIDVQRGDAPSSNVELFGHWILGSDGDCAIETLIDVSTGDLCARLAEGSSLQLPDFVAKELPDFLVADIQILDIDINGNHETGTFAATLETLGTLGLTVEGELFGVEDIGFAMTYDGQAYSTSGHGVLDMFGAAIGVRFAVAGDAVGLSFALTSLNLSDLAEVFLSALGTKADLGDLALKDLRFDLERPTGNFRVRASLGSPVHLGGDTAWAVDEAIFEAARTGPGAEGLTAALSGVMTLGGIPLALSVDYSDAQTRFKGQTDPAAEVDLTDLLSDVFARFGFSLPPQIPDLRLRNLAFEYNSSTRDWAFSGDSTVAAKVQLGDAEHDIHTRLDLKVGTGADGKRTYAGFLRGELKLGSAMFQVEYDFGDASILKGHWDGSGGALQFSDLAKSHGIEHSLQPPGGMALDLQSAAFEFEIAKSRFVLTAASKYGEAFFIASDVSGQWDFAFGVLLQFSDIPGFPSLGPLNLEDAVLILSTVADDKFAVPGLPNRAAPPGLPLTAGHAFPILTAARPMRLSPGVSVAALLSFGDGSDPILRNLGDLVGSSELLIQATFDETADSASFLSYLNGSLTIAGAGNEKLVLSNVFIKLEAEPLAVLISGSVLIPFDHVTLEATGALAVSENGMQALFQIKAMADGRPAALPSPFGLRGVELDEIDVEVGVIFEPPGVDLGIKGKFNIGGQAPGANEFIVVLELEGEVPNPIYLSTHIQTLSIKEIVTIYSGDSVSQVPAVIDALKAEDLSIYWSEAAGIVLPDGKASQQGFGFNGIVTIGGFSAHAALAVGAAGVSGEAELPPIDWGVFTLTRPTEPTAGGPAPAPRAESIIAPGGVDHRPQQQAPALHEHRRGRDSVRPHQRKGRDRGRGHEPQVQAEGGCRRRLPRRVRLRGRQERLQRALRIRSRHQGRGRPDRDPRDRLRHAVAGRRLPHPVRRQRRRTARRKQHRAGFHADGGRLVRVRGSGPDHAGTDHSGGFRLAQTAPGQDPPADRRQCGRAVQRPVRRGQEAGRGRQEGG